MTLITNWIHTRLEYVSGSITGIISAATSDVPVDTGHHSIEYWIFKGAMVILFGFLGAMGAGLWKWVEKKLKKK